MKADDYGELKARLAKIRSLPRDRDVWAMFIATEIDRAVRKARREEREKLLRASFVEHVRAVRSGK
jgi:hypothetical protein